VALFRASPIEGDAWPGRGGTYVLDVGEAFFWGLVAASSLLLGALVVFIHCPESRTIGLVMGFGAGVLLAAVAYELVEEAVEVSGGAGGVPLGLLVGAVVFTVGDTAISRMGYRDRKDIDGMPADASALAIVLGIVLDGVPESAVIGLSLLEGAGVSVAVLVAVFISNVPESIAASTGLLNGGWTRSRLLLLWGAIALVSGLSSAAGYGLLDTASGSTLAFVDAFAGGAILAMLSTTMMPEAYEHAGRATGIVTTFGFLVAFALNKVA
jgi:zinc transporter, ZIP family